MNIYKITLRKEVWGALKSTLSDDETRYVLKCLHIGQGYIEATDGRMLVRYTDITDANCNAPEGTYKVLGKNKLTKHLIEVTLEQTDLTFPNTNQIYPALVEEYISIPMSNDSQSISSAILNIYEYSGNAYNYDLIERIAKTGYTWDCYKYGDEKPCLFVSGDLTAVIMPFQLKRAEVMKNDVQIVA